LSLFGRVELRTDLKPAGDRCSRGRRLHRRPQFDEEAADQMKEALDFQVTFLIRAFERNLMSRRLRSAGLILATTI
jgi:hypothetical protein